MSVTGDFRPDGLAPSARVGGVSNKKILSLREQFLSDPGNTDLSMLRPVIARSWQRSQSWNVLSAPTALASATDPRVDEQLLLAAEPVITELERVCVEVGGSIVLTDADGTLAIIRGAAKEMRRSEQLFPLIGARMAEDSIGTNSDGTAIEENHAVQVWGAEHFNDALKASYCTSVPIRDPIRRSTRGVLGLTVPESVARDVSPRSILLLVEGAAADITRRLAERLAAREQALLSEYMREVRKRGADSVIAMDDRTTIASRSALSMLDQSDFAVLAALAREAEPGNAARHSLSVSDGRQVQLHLRPMETSEFGSGGAAVMRVHVPDGQLRAPRAARRPEIATRFTAMVGSSPAVRRALDAAGTAVARKVPAYIVGEQGTGKKTLAQEIAATMSQEVVVFDLPTTLTPVQLLDDVDSALARGAAVVLHRVDRARPVAVEELAALLQLLEQPQVVVTAGVVTDDVTAIVSALRGIEITMPPLRSRREDIPALARCFLDQAGHDDVRLSSKLRDTLVSADWPGNVQQLSTLIVDIAAGASTSELRLSDLSDVQQRALQVSRLSRLEEAELQQIRQALTESAGNRVKAATLLGIGRSTLYRKIEAYAARGFDIELE
jgi:sigma-54 dependent transcriptional regulator, acetoin dehydrogenase operon transcriptional activator AcoR